MKYNLLIKFLIIPCVLLVTLATAQETEVKEPDSIVINSHKPYQIEEINKEIERAEKTFSRMKYILKADESSMRNINNEFRLFNKVIQNEVEELTKNKTTHYSKFVLDNTYFIWKDFNMKLMDWQYKVNAKIKNNKDFIEELEIMEDRWNLTMNSADTLSKPENLKGRIESVLKQATELRTEFLNKQTGLISLENDIAAQTSLCTFVVEKVIQLQENLRDSLLIATTPPLFSTPLPASHYTPVSEKLKLFWHITSKTVLIYYRSQKFEPIILLLFICILIIYSVKYGLKKLNYEPEALKKKEIQSILFDFPSLTILALFFLHYRVFFPYHPLIMGKLIVLFLLIGSKYFLPGFNDPKVRKFLSRLVLLLSLNYIQMIFWYFGNVIRFYVFIEQIIGLWLTFYYLRPAFWRTLPHDFKLIRAGGILSIFVFIFFFFSTIANLSGFFDLSIMLLKIGLHVPAFTVILYGVYKIWIAITSAVLLIGKATKESYLTHYWEKIEKRALKVVAAILIMIWIYFVAVLFEISNPLYLWINEFLLAKRTVGTLELTIGAIFMCILILVFTFFLTGVIRFIIDDEFIKKSKLPRGVIAAISVSIRYIIVVLGIMFALSAAGIELGKFGLLAGALGVGIGFGLQNIVNNFISGLILVYERPIQVGDTIEIENLMGKVRKIGLRSSHVLTYDGAEVVVPNGNLISNQLINWTLTDNQRRIEIKMGTAYGSDPNVVLKLLEEVALENNTVHRQPPPLALFEGFGESSLNFRLLFWVSFEDGLVTKSNVAIAIYNKLKENNIEIPFPQMDLHLKNKLEN